MLLWQLFILHTSCALVFKKPKVKKQGYQNVLWFGRDCFFNQYIYFFFFLAVAGCGSPAEAGELLLCPSWSLSPSRQLSPQSSNISCLPLFSVSNVPNACFQMSVYYILICRVGRPNAKQKKIYILHQEHKPFSPNIHKWMDGST